jgi:hypothetical protein
MFSLTKKIQKNGGKGKRNVSNKKKGQKRPKKSFKLRKKIKKPSKGFRLRKKIKRPAFTGQCPLRHIEYIVIWEGNYIPDKYNIGTNTRFLERIRP